jgi:hypothetical protein
LEVDPEGSTDPAPEAAAAVGSRAWALGEAVSAEEEAAEASEAVVVGAGKLPKEVRN